MTKEKLNFILLAHSEWLSSAGKSGSRADLSNENMAGAILIGANLTRANLTDANLTDAILIGAILIGANLTRAKLIDANLTRTNLSMNCRFSIRGNKHFITMVNEYLSIGCHTKTIPEWEKTYIEIATRNDYSSSDIEKYRKIIYGVIQLLDQNEN